MAATPNSAPSTRPVRIRKAEQGDVEALSRLINAAFVVERVVFDGDRVDATRVLGYMTTGTFLLAEDGKSLVGCVYVQMHGDRGYLGLLSVDPPKQGLGVGRQLVLAAETFAKEAGACAMDLRVISARAELLPFYRRAGYEQTGTAQFAPEVVAKIPSHYILMSKSLN